MELKPFQQKVINDLEEFLDYLETYKLADKAFNQYLRDRYGENCFNNGFRPYQNNIPNAANVCIKVPTAGGKTIIAINALKNIFDRFADDKPKTVIWLVPWSNLLEQTKTAFNNIEHPYHQKLNALFNHRIGIYTKEELLQGADFNPVTVKEQLSILILNYSSLRRSNTLKEDLKIYQENGYLASFKEMYTDKSPIDPDFDETALINVIRNLNPVVIVDESHNAESELSVDMLNNLNPSFVLDLTATPRENSNIISYTSAIALKKENMVKLPVIVYNNNSKKEVIANALELQRKLEDVAAKESNGNKYIRPIVLFQAQPRTNDDSTTFEKLKEHLIELRIPEDQIKIKTANINELKYVDLSSPDCSVRYIITINALKEGWDCPFAYILASLADKSSVIYVTQILGRILRQPEVRKHKHWQLNLSYVLTASSKFYETLQSIVKGLNEAGFSDKDYRSQDMSQEEASEKNDSVTKELFPEQPDADNKGDQELVDQNEINPQKIKFDPENTHITNTADNIENFAEKQNEKFQKQLEQQEDDVNNEIPEDVKNKVNEYKIKDVFIDDVKDLSIPQFFLKIQGNELFGTDNNSILLNKDSLLDGFKLSNADTHINFNEVSSELYKIDLEETKKDTYVAALAKIEDPKTKGALVEYILSRPKKSQIEQLAGRMVNIIGKMHPIPDKEIQNYVEKILDNFNDAQIKDFINREYSYRDIIKKKIKDLSDEYAENQFNKYLDTDKIYTAPSFKLPQKIILGSTSEQIHKSLYEKEAKMNQFERKVILEIANLDNIEFWHRNLGRGKGFNINGFKSNHYPDFIVKTKTGKIIVIETKGDDRDNSDSAAKNRLGQQWSNKAGESYKYFMVFENNKIKDTLNIAELKGRLKEL